MGISRPRCAYWISQVIVRQGESVFRRVFQICGVAVVGWFAALAIGLVQLFAQGDLPLGAFLLRMFLCVCGGCGLGVLMMLLNPHKVIQNYQSMRVHRMVGQRRDARSFAEKIGADDD